MIDGRNDPVKRRTDEEDTEEESLMAEESEESRAVSMEWHSTTDPLSPCTTDRL